MFELADIKWGTPTLGESGGNVQWNMDLSEGLVFNEELYETSDFEDAMRAAFDAWEDVADINFVESLGDAEISVGMRPLDEEIIGLAELTFIKLPGTDQFISADLSLDSDEEWAPFGETDLNFYAVAAHEIGHALGLLHVDDPTQLMNAFLTESDLGEGDIAGAQELYGEAPIPVFEADEDTTLSFFERFFSLILSIFGLGGSTTVAATKPSPWPTPTCRTCRTSSRSPRSSTRMACPTRSGRSFTLFLTLTARWTIHRVAAVAAIAGRSSFLPDPQARNARPGFPRTKCTRTRQRPSPRAMASASSTEA